MNLFQSGSCEPLKRGVHGSMLGLAAVCLTYNVLAFALRRETHLAVNVVLYGALVAWEDHVMTHHTNLRRSVR